MTAENRILKACIDSVMKKAYKEAGEIKRFYSLRKNKRKLAVLFDAYFMLRFETKRKLLRLNLAEDWVDKYLENNFKVCRKNSRGNGTFKHH